MYNFLAKGFGRTLWGADRVNQIADGNFTNTLGGSVTHAPAQDATNGSYGRISLPATDNIACVAVNSNAQYVPVNGRPGVLTVAFRVSEAVENEIFIGWVVRGDTTINGDTNFASDLISVETVDGSATLRLNIARDAGSRAAYATLDTGFAIVANTWYVLEIRALPGAQNGNGRLEVAVRGGSTLENAIYATLNPANTYALSATTQWPWDEALAPAIAFYNGEAVAKTMDWAFIDEQVPMVPIGRAPVS